ncbi:MAG: DUF3806 domain-containing protein [Halieaceae bacterium]|nr:DUF3806 domain-containing protein [Halieaceae bacterium]
MALKHTLTVFLLLIASWPQLILAQPYPRIENLSRIDLNYMDQQRNDLRGIAAAELGRQFSGQKGRDLALLQSMLDEGLVAPDQVREMQAMGIMMGDLLAAEFELNWVVYADQAGRSRALRYRDSDFFLYPVTMISRRRTAGDMTPVDDIYERAARLVEQNTPASPFQ